MEITKKLTLVGAGSVGLVIPKDVCDYLEVDEHSDVVLSIEEGKKGKFMALWKKKVE